MFGVEKNFFLPRHHFGHSIVKNLPLWKIEHDPNNAIHIFWLSKVYTFIIRRKNDYTRSCIRDLTQPLEYNDNFTEFSSPFQILSTNITQAFIWIFERKIKLFLCTENKFFALSLSFRKFSIMNILQLSVRHCFIVSSSQVHTACQYFC